MGLGKTIQSITVLSLLQGACGISPPYCLCCSSFLPRCELLRRTHFFSVRDSSFVSLHVLAGLTVNALQWLSHPSLWWTIGEANLSAFAPH